MGITFDKNIILSLAKISDLIKIGNRVKKMLQNLTRLSILVADFVKTIMHIFSVSI